LETLARAHLLRSLLFLLLLQAFCHTLFRPSLAALRLVAFHLLVVVVMSFPTLFLNIIIFVLNLDVLVIVILLIDNVVLIVISRTRLLMVSINLLAMHRIYWHHGLNLLNIGFSLFCNNWHLNMHVLGIG